jgi:hypothetical protein
MKCPECEQLGLQSILWMAGAGVKTDLAPESFCDENGQYHFHDPNQMGESAICSNGHQMMIRHGNECSVKHCNYGEPTSIIMLQTA